MAEGRSLRATVEGVFDEAAAVLLCDDCGGTVPLDPLYVDGVARCLDCFESRLRYLLDAASVDLVRALRTRESLRRLRLMADIAGADARYLEAR